MANSRRIEKEIMFNRLAIGAANWGREYNGAKVSEDDQKRILDYCQCSGIDMIDTATAYEWDWTNANSYFHIVSKGKAEDLANPSDFYAYLSHGSLWGPFWERIVQSTVLVGLSIYEPADIPAFGTFGVQIPNVIQVPYSLFDRRFEKYFAEWKSLGIEIHVRSIFLRGKVLEKATPQECISFCLMNPNVDRVIIGADSFKQFQENLQFLHNWNKLEVTDENILDPRLWKEKT